MVKLLKPVIFYVNFICFARAEKPLLFPDKNTHLHTGKTNFFKITPDYDMCACRRPPTNLVIKKHHDITDFVSDFIGSHPKVPLVLNHPAGYRHRASGCLPALIL